MSDMDLVPLDRLIPWFDANGVGSGPVESVRLLTGGTQNVLLRFVRGDRAYVLRRPPRHKRESSDETMRRESTVLRALAGSNVPHPALVAACDDLSVIGSFFYVMAAIDGFNATVEVPDRIATDLTLQRLMGETLVDGIAELGEVRPDGPVLAGFGRADGWLERQVGRWARQLESYAKVAGWPGPDLPHLDTVTRWLVDHRPSSWKPGVIHGDYHFGNVMFDPVTARLAAIVDWELSTIGDPLLDLGHLLATWPVGDPSRSRVLSIDLPGLPGRDELVSRYAALSSRDLDNVDWYRVLACYRLAILLEGTHARAHAGKATAELGETFHQKARGLFEQAATVIAGESVSP